MTKHIQDDSLKCPLGVDDVKVEGSPKIIDDTMILFPSHVISQSKDLEVGMIEAKVTTKKDHLEKATSYLYDLEGNSGPEKPLNINFNLHQMEEY